MKKVLVLSLSDFNCDKYDKNCPGLNALKPDLLKLENLFDVIGYLEGETLVLLKNRYGSIKTVQMNPDVAYLFAQ